MVFIGGAVLAEVCKNRDNFWLTRQEYQEQVILLIIKIKIEASGGAVARGATVKLTGCGFDPHSRR